MYFGLWYRLFLFDFAVSESSILYYCIIILILGTDDDRGIIETCLPCNKLWWEENVSIMAYATLLHSLPAELRTIFRQYENINKKFLNTKWSIEFNSICLIENILPNYSNTHTHTHTHTHIYIYINIYIYIVY